MAICAVTANVQFIQIYGWCILEMFQNLVLNLSGHTGVEKATGKIQAKSVAN